MIHGTISNLEGDFDLDLEVTTNDIPDSADKRYVTDAQLAMIGASAVESVNGLDGVVVLDTGDLSEVTDKKYVTDAEKTKLSNLSGTNSGDETTSSIKSKLSITTLSGDNTGDETTSSIKSKLSITTLSGSNTGDQTLNSLLPSQSGNSGKYLKTDGTDATWQTTSGGGGTQFCLVVATSGGDYTSVMDALTFARSNGNLPVVIREGTFTESGSLLPNDKLIGYGMGRTIIKQPNGAQANVFSANDASGIQIYHLTLDGNKANNASGDNGLAIFSGDTFKIENVEFKNNKLKGFVIASDAGHTKNGKLIDCKFNNNDQDGATVASGTISSGYICSDIHFVRCNAYDNTLYGMAEVSPDTTYNRCVNIKWTDCNAYNNGTYGFEHKGGIRPSMQNCYSYLNGHHGVNIGLHTNAQFRVTSGSFIGVYSYNNSKAASGYSGINKQYMEYTLIDQCHVFDDQGTHTQKGITDSGNNGSTNVTGTNVTWGNLT